MTIKTKTTAAGSALLIGLLSACGAGEPGAGSGTSPAQARSGSGSSAEQIPEGSYTRVATVDEGVALGLAAGTAGEVTGPDGELPLELVFRSGEWEHLVTNDAGIAELGDLGTYSYDTGGRLVTVSQSSGCPGCTATWTWSVAGDVLTLSSPDPADLDPVALLVTMGDWTRNE